MLEQLNLTVWTWVEAFKDLRHGRLLLPLLFFAAVQSLVVLLLSQFYQPLLSFWMVPLLKAIQSEQSLHYPQFFALLPETFSRVNLVLDWVVGSLAFGAAFATIWCFAARVREERPWTTARRRYLSLLFARLPGLLLVLLVVAVIPALFQSGETGPTGNALRALRYGTFLLAVFVESLFVFTPLLIVSEGRGVLSALLGGPVLMLRVPLATYLVVLVPSLAQLPISAVLRRTDTIVRTLAPELVGWLMVITALVYVFVNYFIVSSVVRIYGARAVEEAGGRPWRA